MLGCKSICADVCFCLCVHGVLRAIENNNDVFLLVSYFNSVN